MMKSFPTTSFCAAIAALLLLPCAYSRLAADNHQAHERRRLEDTNNNRDVCVIGAGAAGVSAAYFLEEYGYSVSVFEKLDRVGGKCFSPSVGPNGERIDLGAALLTSNYVVTRMFASQFNVELKPTTAAYVTHYGTQSIIPRSGDPVALQTAVEFYISIINTKYPDLLNTPGFEAVAHLSSDRLDELTMSFFDWLTAHNLQGLAPFFTLPIPYFGYGLLTEIPAMYAIKYMNERNARSLLALVAYGSNTPTDLVAKVVGGTQALVEAIAESLEDVHLSADVSIDRKNPNTDNAPSILKYRDGDGKQHTFRCGQVIAAFPQKSSLMGFMDLDDRERAIFDKPFTQIYASSSVHGFFTPEGEELLSGSYYNVEFADPAAQQQWDGSTVLFAKNFDDVNYAVVMQYALPGSSQTDEDICAKIPDDLQSYGVTKEDIAHFNRWEYFPAVSSADIRSGYYADLEDLQGYRNTFYTGGLLNFELLENVMAYSKKLVETHFPNKN